MIFQRKAKQDINTALTKVKATENAVLIDVRTPEEYAAGHIPGSINLPNGGGNIEAKVPAKDTPLFLYCLSGARSAKALRLVAAKGYTNATNIGGINCYQGKIEK